MTKLDNFLKPKEKKYGFIIVTVLGEYKRAPLGSCL